MVSKFCEWSSFQLEKRDLVSPMLCLITRQWSNKHFTFVAKREISLRIHSGDLFTWKDNMLFSLVKVCFRAKAHLIFHWCYIINNCFTRFKRPRLVISHHLHVSFYIRHQAPYWSSFRRALCGFWYEELAFSGNKWMGIILSALWLISNVYLFELLFSLILFTMKVVDDSGRPKFQVQFKGETKSFFPEEVSKPFSQLASSSVSQPANQPTNQAVYMVWIPETNLLPSYLAYFLAKLNQPFTGGSRTCLGGRASCLASASMVTLLASRTTFLSRQLWTGPLLIYV